MHTNYLEKLEFNKIKTILSEHAITNLGKEKTLNLLPMTNYKEVLNEQNKTTEAQTLIYRKGSVPITPLENIEENIINIKNQNFLSIESLLEITKLLSIPRELKDYYFDEEITNPSEYLKNYFDDLYLNTNIEKEIQTAILDEQTLDDKASPDLYKIRTSIKNIQKDIKNKLQSLLSSKYLQEPIITIKQNRYVVPVKVEYKQEVKGLTHDISSSGSTLFIEPLSVFELNNKLADLQLEETIEIEKILQKLSALFFNISDELENNYKIIGTLDFIFAKAKYSKDTNSTSPKINNEKFIYLKQARHPLINPTQVVPITVELGKDYSTLLITGPNTGGKTVTIKTIGLLTLMAQSGMHIPASPESSIYIFDNIFADIGDEQSILESLSTFSSHMKNIVNILNESTSESLILVDELGSGTDPVEGSTLAQSILEHLKTQNTLTVATTHYQNLKEYALTTQGVENASCEFNIDTLSPTYRLLIGVPGKSNAFAISQKLGLSPEILKNAKNLINQDTAKIEDLLKEIYDSKALIEQEKEKILTQSKQIEELKLKLEHEKNDIENHKKEYIQKSKQEAKEILLDAKQEANEIIKELQNSQTNTQKINKLRNNLNEKINQVSKQEKQTNTNPISESEIKPGLEVFVPKFNQTGTILTTPNKDKKVNIQIGLLKTSIPIAELQKTMQKQSQKNQISTKKNSNFTPKKVNTELNIIGLNIEESLLLVDKFLDNASLSKLEQVRIVHGKGTGALGKGIQNYLKKHPHCKSYRYGTYGEGEMGVTIVELK